MTVLLERHTPKKMSSAWRTQQRQRELQALEMHLAGMTYERIAEQLGYQGRGQVWRLVHKLLDRVEAEGAEQLRASKGAQLDRLMVAVWPAALKGDPKSVAEARRLNESYRRLFGLDAPVKIDATVRDATQVQIDELAQQLGMTAGPVQVPTE